jgi:hypothetical protein
MKSLHRSSVSISPVFTNSGQINWTGGTIQGALFVATNGLFALGGTAAKYTNVADVRGVELDLVPSNNLAQEVAQFTVPLPVLSIELAGNSVTISWPATTSTNFVLQSSTRLFPASWSDVPDAPANVNGRFQVTQSIANQSRYYRLLSR